MIYAMRLLKYNLNLERSYIRGYLKAKNEGRLTDIRIAEMSKRLKEQRVNDLEQAINSLEHLEVRPDVKRRVKYKWLKR